MMGVAVGFLALLWAGQAGADVGLVLDANLREGYQGGAIVRAGAGDLISMEIYATGVEGAQGLSARLSYDPSLLSFDGFTSAGLIPGGTGLVLQEAAGIVEVGAVSVRGAVTAGEGRVGVVRFRVAGAPDGAKVEALSGKASVGGTTVETAGTTSVRFVTDVPGGLALDADAAPGFDGSTVVAGVRAGSAVEVELFGTGLTDRSGFSARLTYDEAMLRFDGYTAGVLIPRFTGLTLEGSGSVTVGGASVSGTAAADEGSLGTVRFTVLSAFDGDTPITLDVASLAGAGGETALTPSSTVSVTGTKVEKQGDFDGNGAVDFGDFIAFASRFGAVSGDAKYNALFDLDDSGAIDFGDFIRFAASFGK